MQRLLDKLYAVHEKVRDEINDYENWILQTLKDSVNHMRCFFKNDSFIDEREYRFVLRVPEKYILSQKKEDDIKEGDIKEDNIMEKGFFRRGNIQIPYIDYKIKREGLKKIIINPYAKGDNGITKFSIENMLWMYNYKDVKDVYYSNIPMRKYN